MKILDLLFGKPLASSEERAEQIGSAAGVGIFGLDALSSAAYGPEAALVLLIPLGLGGIHLILPVMTAIIILLALVFFSYRQTIEAYPQGGGSYTVATENLGTGPGLLAAAALMIDYILTVAVSISAGVEALVSAVPQLAAAHAGAVPADSAAAHVGQYAWRARRGRGVPDSDLSVCGHAAGCDRGGPDARGVERRASACGGCAAHAAVEGDGAADVVAAAEGVCERLHGDDGRGGGIERRAGVSRSDG